MVSNGALDMRQRSAGPHVGSTFSMIWIPELSLLADRVAWGSAEWHAASAMESAGIQTVDRRPFGRFVGDSKRRVRLRRMRRLALAEVVVSTRLVP
jgi:hypothetical protein